MFCDKWIVETVRLINSLLSGFVARQIHDRRELKCGFMNAELMFTLSELMICVLVLHHRRVSSYDGRCYTVGVVDVMHG